MADLGATDSRLVLPGCRGFFLTAFHSPNVAGEGGVGKTECPLRPERLPNHQVAPALAMLRLYLVPMLHEDLVVPSGVAGCRLACELKEYLRQRLLLAFHRVIVSIKIAAFKRT